MESFPKISILVAARNEEASIVKCLEALNQVDYPREKLEILIGNDGSTDTTHKKASDYIADKPWFRLFTIEYALAGLQGKANVLEQLSFYASGEYYFYCDADIEVPPTWVKGMLTHFKDDTIGVVNGITSMQPYGLYADLQSLEWLFALSAFRLLSLFQIPVTSMGNNMAVNQKAYQAVGGYTAIGFSLVEDYALFQAILKKGYAFSQAYTTSVIAQSVPNFTLAQQFKQRKRWMQGAMQLSWPFILLFILICLLPIVGILMVPFAPLTGSILLLTYILPLLLGGGIAIIRLQQYRLFPVLIAFPCYCCFMNLLSLYSYYSKGDVQWKQRNYNPVVP